MAWPELQLESTLGQALLIGARIGMLMVFAPFFGSLAVSPRVKAGLTLALTALLYPILRTSVAWPDPAQWIQVLCGEVLVGLMLGLTVHFIFDAVQLAGQVMGFQLGFSLANLVDPETEVDTPVLSAFHQAIALLIFLQLDVHHLTLRGLAKSFEYLPPGTVSATATATHELIRAAGAMLLVAVQLAAPVLVATLLADIALGFMGKASPQLPVLFVGLSAKNVIALAVLIGAVAFWPDVLQRRFVAAAATTERLLHLAR